MTGPRFVDHLPPGPMLDWAFSEAARAGKRLELTCAPSSATVIAHWENIDDATAARITLIAVEPALLDWIAANGTDRRGVRRSLLRNPSVALKTLDELLAGGSTPAENDAVRATRRNDELGALLLRGRVTSTDEQQSALWLAEHVAASPDPEVIADAAGALAADHHGAFLATILGHDPSTARFPLGPVLDLIAEGGDHVLARGAAHDLGRHLSTRGTPNLIRRALTLTRSTALRAPMVSTRSAAIEQVAAGLPRSLLIEMLACLDEERLLDRDETRFVVERLTSTTDRTVKATPEVMHSLRCSDDAATWAATEHDDPVVAGALVWQCASNQILVRSLRTNPESHRWASRHVWRLGSIWHRLSHRVRADILAAFDATALSNLAPGPVRDSVIEHGTPQVVLALNLRRGELRSIVERAERSNDAELAWVAAKIADRPRDRVRMAEIGLQSPSWEPHLRDWLRGSQAGEICRLWVNVAQPMRPQVARIMVANLRGCDDTSWVDRIVGELSVDWNDAPASVQEAAALWLSRHSGSSAEHWSCIWSLYPEWTGTLPDLIDAARTL